MSDLGIIKTSLKILVIGPSWVGDMVLAQSLFKTLHHLHKNIQIDVIAPEWTAQLLDMMPEVYRSINMPIAHGELKLKTRINIARELKKEDYDWAIILPNSFKSALIPWLASIPKRSGWRGEFRYGLLNDLRIPDLILYPKTAQRYSALAFSAFDSGKASEAILSPPPSLQPSNKIIEEAMALFGLDLIRPILALCPGAEFGQSKRWPTKYFKQVAQKYINDGGQVWLFGSAADRISCEEIAKVANSQNMKNLAGETTLTQAVALLSQADKVVANDSGLMHVAAALKKPVIAIYGSTSEGHTPPLSEISTTVAIDIDCRPCQKRECPYGHYRCLKELKPERVIEALERV